MVRAAGSWQRSPPKSEANPAASAPSGAMRPSESAHARSALMLPPISPGFLNLIERFERQLARILALLLIAVLVAATFQLLLFTGMELLDREQSWLGGGLLLLLDRLLLLLIGLEVLQNVTAYLKDHEIQIELVLLTALTAMARKVIVLPPGQVKDPLNLVGIGVVIACISGSYALMRWSKSRSVSRGDEPTP